MGTLRVCLSRRLACLAALAAMIGLPTLARAQSPETSQPGSGSPLKPRSNGAHWGSFKADHCSGIGTRQHSAVLQGIQGSWEEACYSAGNTFGKYSFARPARCVNTTFAMWGEFDVPDDSCKLKWGEFKRDDCKGVGRRQYSAVLWDINKIKGLDWHDACAQSPALIEGIWFEHPARCRNAGMHMWGEFEVPDASCGPIAPL